MIKYYVILLVSVMISTVIVMLSANLREVSENFKTSCELFLEKPSLVLWHQFEVDIRTGHYDASRRVFRDVLEYHDARLKRDLPNSMALSDVKPNNFVANQQRRADSAFLSIKAQESNDLWRILEKLSNQSFDEDLMRTSCEIAARLSPSKFMMVEQGGNNDLQPCLRGKIQFRTIGR